MANSVSHLNIAISRRRFQQLFARCSALCLLPLLTGCGTILYPGRWGQRREGPLNWKVVALDSCLLLLFVFPGMIAFAVDWWSGTLFLPNGHYGNLESPARGEKFRKISLGPKPTLEQIMAAVKRETGRSIDIESQEFFTRPLPSLDHFDEVEQELIALSASGDTTYRCQSPAIITPHAAP